MQALTGTQKENESKKNELRIQVERQTRENYDYHYLSKQLLKRRELSNIKKQEMENLERKLMKDAKKKIEVQHTLFWKEHLQRVREYIVSNVEVYKSKLKKDVDAAQSEVETHLNNLITSMQDKKERKEIIMKKTKKSVKAEEEYFSISEELDCLQGKTEKYLNFCHQFLTLSARVKLQKYEETLRDTFLKEGKRSLQLYQEMVSVDTYAHFENSYQEKEKIINV